MVALALMTSQAERARRADGGKRRIRVANRAPIVGRPVVPGARARVARGAVPLRSVMIGVARRAVDLHGAVRIRAVAFRTIELAMLLVTEWDLAGDRWCAPRHDLEDDRHLPSQLDLAGVAGRARRRLVRLVVGAPTAVRG